MQVRKLLHLYSAKLTRISESPYWLPTQTHARVCFKPIYYFWSTVLCCVQGVNSSRHYHDDSHWACAKVFLSRD